jgi:hypothetical protein
MKEGGSGGGVNCGGGGGAAMVAGIPYIRGKRQTLIWLTVLPISNIPLMTVDCGILSKQ